MFKEEKKPRRAIVNITEKWIILYFDFSLIMEYIEIGKMPINKLLLPYKKKKIISAAI